MHRSAAHRLTASTLWSGEPARRSVRNGSEALISTRLLLDAGADPAVLMGVGSNVAEDAQLGDVGIVFGVDAFELWMERSVAGARQASVALVHLGVGVTLLEVDEMVFTGDPGWHGVLG